MVHCNASKLAHLRVLGQEVEPNHLLPVREGEVGITILILLCVSVAANHWEPLKLRSREYYCWNVSWLVQLSLVKDCVGRLLL